MSGINSAKSDNCLVVGNGESRSQLILQEFKDHYTLIGCNALCRDITVDHLVVCDRRMVEEAVQNPNTFNSVIHVRDDWYHYYRKIRKNKNVKCLPDIPYSSKFKADEKRNWGSGTYAILLAAQMTMTNIFLVGFDLYGNQRKINNIYKNTANYNQEDSHAIDPSFWIYQTSKIFSLYPNKNFIVVNKEDWSLPIEWNKNNVQFKSINSFLLDNKYPCSIIST